MMLTMPAESVALFLLVCYLAGVSSLPGRVSCVCEDGEGEAVAFWPTLSTSILSVMLTTIGGEGCRISLFGWASGGSLVECCLASNVQLFSSVYCVLLVSGLIFVLLALVGSYVCSSSRFGSSTHTGALVDRRLSCQNQSSMARSSSSSLKKSGVLAKILCWSV